MEMNFFPANGELKLIQYVARLLSNLQGFSRNLTAIIIQFMKEGGNCHISFLPL